VLVLNLQLAGTWILGCHIAKSYNKFPTITRKKMGETQNPSLAMTKRFSYIAISRRAVEQDFILLALASVLRQRRNTIVPLNKRLERKLHAVKLVACDLDGTLLNNQSVLTERTKALVRELQHEGIEFALLTGRPHSSALPYAEALRIAAPIVSLNGLVVKSIDGKQRLHHAALSPEMVMEILWLTRVHPVQIVLLTEDQLLFTKENAVIPSYLREWNVECWEVESYYQWTENAVQVLLSGSYEELKTFMRELRRLTSTKVAHVLYPSEHRQGVWYLELRPEGVSKATGLDYIKKYCNIKSKEIAAIGDFYNDLEFCQDAGVTIAMQNAVDELKAVADYITERTNDDEGAAEFLQLLLNVRRGKTV
jgi:Cof subfamily protein (haloacid dehalogenase superfamily)